jgi:hypothetical protein
MIRELRAAGFLSRSALADELNRAGIPTVHGGRWHRTTVTRILTRLGLITSGKDARINNGQAKKHAADMRAETLASNSRDSESCLYLHQCHRARAERARDTNRAGWQMAPNQREPTAATLEKAEA